MLSYWSNNAFKLNAQLLWFVAFQVQELVKYIDPVHVATCTCIYMYMYLHVYVLMVVKISVQHLVFSPGIYLHVCGLWCVLKFWLYLYLHIYMYSLVYSAYKIDTVLQKFIRGAKTLSKLPDILTYFYHSCPTPIVQFQVTRHSRKMFSWFHTTVLHVYFNSMSYM